MPSQQIRVNGQETFPMAVDVRALTQILREQVVTGELVTLGMDSLNEHFDRCTEREKMQLRCEFRKRK